LSWHRREVYKYSPLTQFRHLHLGPEGKIPRLGSSGKGTGFRAGNPEPGSPEAPALHLETVKRVKTDAVACDSPGHSETFPDTTTACCLRKGAVPSWGHREQSVVRF